TPPAPTELEIRVIDWLRQMIGLPDDFSGCIQDSASSATLCAILTARERALNWRGNAQGLSGHPHIRIYCADQVHSSIDKAMWVAGLGQANLVKLPTGASGAMDVHQLDAAISADRRAGHLPAGIVACIGSTGVGASDDIAAVAGVAQREKLYLHVDAAWAGAAMICAEFRHMMAGAELADSFVFNPHKWLFTNFDCSAHFVREPNDLMRTLAIKPDYLKTDGQDGVINFSEWSVPLGRRFRALKLWFVIRAYGVEKLRDMLRHHITWAGELAARIDQSADFELTSDPVLSLFTFRYAPPGAHDLDALNAGLLEAINDDGRIYLTKTRHQGNTVIRFQVGQTNTTSDDVALAWEVIRQIAAGLKSPGIS
ncbi:MAG: aspartate aminotransferase family protein, partial [Hyphomicrobiales bacterium]